MRKALRISATALTVASLSLIAAMPLAAGPADTGRAGNRGSSDQPVAANGAGNGSAGAADRGLFDDLLTGNAPAAFPASPEVMRSAAFVGPQGARP